MRIFVQQERVMCDFNTADSWVILSPIEQSIKRKIEAVGIPLKDWDINIYRGVLTGCNEAFIINSTKRKEILANCQSAEEKERTEELIRPILRGRDIKRYGYEWADLWLIYIPWHFPYQFDNSMLNIQSLIRFPIPPVSNPKIIENSKVLQNHFSQEIQETLDSLIYDSYGFSKEEIEEIERC